MSNYFAISLVEALESKMIPKKIMRDLTINESFPQIEKILCDYGYCESDKERKIYESRIQLETFVINHVEKQEIKYFILLKKDCTTIKRVLKEILFNKNGLKKPEGNIKPEEIKEKILNQLIVNVAPLPESIIESCVRECFEARERNIGNIIDTRIDRLYFDIVKLFSEKSNNMLLKEYIKYYSFFGNLKILYRARAKKSLRILAEYSWLTEAKFSRNEWQKFLEYDDIKLDKVFEIHLTYIKDALNDLKTSQFSKFEKSLELFWIQKVIDSRLHASSDERILAYYFIKEYEFLTIKRLISGKRLGVSSESLLKNLGGMYA